MIRFPYASLLAVACAILLGGCQGAGVGGGGGRRATGSPGSGPGAGRRGDVVSVSEAELAPVDAYFRAGEGQSNTRWILGDEVDIVASREYFASILSINRGAFVRRNDTKVGDDLLVTMTFLGSGSQASAANNPRVQIGTGLTVSAGQTMRVRLTRTRDARVPVRIHITARGRARRGHREQIISEGPILTLGGQLVRSGAGWVWEPTED